MGWVHKVLSWLSRATGIGYQHPQPFSSTETYRRDILAAIVLEREARRTTSRLSEELSRLQDQLRRQ
jgi:hypothetical protein